MSINSITNGSAGGVSVDSRQDVRSAPIPVKASTSAAPISASESGQDIAKNSSAQHDISASELKSSVEQINRAIGLNNSVNLNLDHDSGKVVVQIVDNETKAVLRQIPSKEVLAIAQDLDGKKGIFLNDLA
ncbi:flagellar protein FlaG [Undibacterium sp. Di27W]|uniref:flagellar protein FlaG n=1 Tax=Undibacterium sp. Di27W TaxID=3413036 RepID=UPI003BEFEF17